MAEHQYRDLSYIKDIVGTLILRSSHGNGYFVL